MLPLYRLITPAATAMGGVKDNLNDLLEVGSSEIFWGASNLSTSEEDLKHE